MTLRETEIHALIGAEHDDAFSVLGPHVVPLPGGPGIAVRVVYPDIAALDVVPLAAAIKPREMTRVHPAGVFEAVFSDQRVPFAYRLKIYDAGTTVEIDDAYRFPSTLSDYDRHLLAEGTHENAADKLGAHPMVLAGVAGTTFAVWAPNARRVSVVGDFNHWDGRRHPMRHHPANGIWEIFVPGVAEGVRYKFEIRARSGEPIALKADPYAF